MIRPTFFGIEIGKSGLTLSQLGLDITGHNIANVDTVGYTRQRLISKAYDANATLGRAMPVSRAIVGGGVDVKIHDQIRSAYLDRRFRTEAAINAYWQTRTRNLSYLETFFDDYIEETSVNYSIASFFGAIKILAEDTVEGAPRKLLQIAGKDLAQHMNTIYGGLIELQDSQDLAVETTVGQINRIKDEIVELNKAIYRYEVTGLIALDLRDKRNLLLDELSSIIDIQYLEYEDPKDSGMSKLRVWIGGDKADANNWLIDHKDSKDLGVRKVPNVVQDEDPVWEVFWDDGTGSWGATLTNGDDTIGLNLLTGLDRNAPDFLVQLGAALSDIDGVINDIYALHAADPVANKTKIEALIKELSGLVKDAEFNEKSGKVTIGGVVYDSSAIVRQPADMDAVPEALNLGTLRGELRAYVDMRDGNDVDTRGIPYYINMLNNLARALVQEINDLHVRGWNDDPLGSKNGIVFFDGGDGIDVTSGIVRNYFLDPALNTATLAANDPYWAYYNAYGDPQDPSSDPYLSSFYDPDLDPDEVVYYFLPSEVLSQITAKNLKVSDIIAKEGGEYSIAGSTVKIDKDIPQGLQSGNNENMNKLYEIFMKKDIAINVDDALGGIKTVGIGSFDGYATGIRFDLATTLNFAKKSAESSNILTIAAENQRQSISGVSLDEEMTFLIKYQHAYNGASRVITTMDDALDVLINRTGRVGL